MPADAIAAVLWDFDGTMVDTLSSWGVSETGVLADLGVANPAAMLPELAGWTIWHVAELIVAKLGLDPSRTASLADDINAGWLADVRAHEGSVALPGVAELSADLASAGVPQAVASQTVSPLIRAVAADLGWHLDVVVGGDQVDRPKPDPEPYLKAADALGVDPARCVVLDDSILGLQSGVAAGCVVLGVGVPSDQRVDGVAAYAPTLRGVGLADLDRLVKEHRG